MQIVLKVRKKMGKMKCVVCNMNFYMFNELQIKLLIHIMNKLHP